MAWIEVHQALRDHHKVLLLAERLELPEPHAAGHLVYLWLWAIDNAPDGRLPASAHLVERAAGWPGDRGRFVAALVAVGLLDDADGVLTIHDWDEYAGRLIEKRHANAERMRTVRARARLGDGDVQRTCVARAGATVPNTTEQNRTGETPPLTPPSPPVAASPSPRVSPPFPLLAALCDELGTDVSVLTADQRSKQLAVGKRLVAAGLTDADVRRMVRWLSAQSWVTGGVDLFLLEKQLGKWQLAGKPDRVPATARAPTNGKRDIGYTTAQLKAMAEGGHG